MFEVIVSGSTLYETDDVLCADSIANAYRGIGWKDVKVVDRRFERYYRKALKNSIYLLNYRSLTKHLKQDGKEIPSFRKYCLLGYQNAA